jgi:hypothetical protein
MVSKQTLHPVRRTQPPGIAWTPAHDSYYVLAGLLPHATANLPIHVTQSALLQLEARLGDGARPVPFGLLAGGYYSCPQSRAVYLLVDSVLPSRADLTPEDPRAQIAAELRRLAAEARKGSDLAVGWYLGGMGAAPELDSEVDSLHRELFPERWQVVLLHDTSAETGNGAFVRFESMGEKYYIIPFVEELSGKAAREKSGVRRTAVHWSNYRTTDPVSPLDAPVAAQIAAGGESGSPSSGKRLGQWMESLRRAVSGAPATNVPPRTAVHAGPATRGAASADAPHATVAPPADASRGAVAVPTLATHHVFIDGELITFSEPPAIDGEDRRPASRWDRRSIITLAVLAVLAVTLIVLLAR